MSVCQLTRCVMATPEGSAGALALITTAAGVAITAAAGAGAGGLVLVGLGRGGAYCNNTSADGKGTRITYMITATFSAEDTPAQLQGKKEGVRPGKCFLLEKVLGCSRNTEPHFHRSL